MRRTLTLPFAVCLLVFSASASWGADKHPSQRTTPPSSQTTSIKTDTLFTQREALTYIAKLNEIPAGDGEIRLHKTQHEGRDAYRVTAQGRTNELVDMLFNIRGEADGLFAANGFSPISFHFAFTERDRPRELGVRYDPTTKTLVGLTRKKARVRERREPAAEVYDPFSALYLLRSRDLAPGSSQQIAVFTGKERYQIIARVVRKEKTFLIDGERPAVRLHLQGFKASDGARKNVLPAETTLWVTPEPTHVPLKLESFLPFGQFVVELNGQ